MGGCFCQRWAQRWKVVFGRKLEGLCSLTTWDQSWASPWALRSKTHIWVYHTHLPKTFHKKHEAREPEAIKQHLFSENWDCFFFQIEKLNSRWRELCEELLISYTQNSPITTSFLPKGHGFWCCLKYMLRQESLCLLLLAVLYGSHDSPLTPLTQTQRPRSGLGIQVSKVQYSLVTACTSSFDYLSYKFPLATRKCYPKVYN